MELVEIVPENEIKKEEEDDNSSINKSQLSTYTEIENEYMFNHPRMYSQSISKLNIVKFIIS
jgi:hypothetical protein